MFIVCYVLYLCSVLCPICVASVWWPISVICDDVGYMWVLCDLWSVIWPIYVQCAMTYIWWNWRVFSAHQDRPMGSAVTYLFVHVLIYPTSLTIYHLPQFTTYHLPFTTIDHIPFTTIYHKPLNIYHPHLFVWSRALVYNNNRVVLPFTKLSGLSCAQ